MPTLTASQAKLFEARADRMDGGLNLNTDRLLSPEQISRGSALRFELGSGLMTGPGFRTMATPVANVSTDGMLEANIVKPTMWIKQGTKFQYSHDVGVDTATFYDTGVTATDASAVASGVSGHQGFAEGPDGDIFTSNQTDGPLRFATATVAVAAIFGDTTLNVGSIYIGKFAASGTVYVKGNAITYSGVNATSLTGVAGIPAGGFAIGDYVVQSGTMANFTYKASILAVYQKLLVASGILSQPYLVAWSVGYIVANSNTAAFSFYDFTSTGSGFDVMQNKVTAIIVGTSAAYVILFKGVTKITGINTTTGALTFQPLNNEYGAYNPNCAVDMDGVVAFMGQRRGMPINLTITATGSFPQFDENWDFPLRPWFLSHDDADQQDRAFLKWDSTQKILKLGAVVNGALQTQVHDRHFGRFLGTEQRDVGASCMFKGISYFGHGDNGTINQDDTGRTNAGAPISHIMSTGRIEDDRGRRWMKGKDFIHQGWMTHGTIFTLRIYLNGSPIPIFTRDFDDTLIVENTGRAIGLRGVGLSVPGGASDEGVTVYQFVNPLVIRGINGEDFRFEWEISSDGGFLLQNTWYFSALVPPKGPRTFN